MYQPKIKDKLIRKLYFLAMREGKKMTHMLNEILEEYLVAEPEPPPYEPQWIRYRPSPDAAKRKERANQKMMREYHGGDDVEDIHREAYQGNDNDRGHYPPTREQSTETEAPAHPISLNNQG